jgi:regulatory associated protein of mTOR
MQGGWEPGVYIWDCSAAGNLLQNFNTFAARRDGDINVMHGGYVDGVQPILFNLPLVL